VLLSALPDPSISSSSAETFPWISTTRFIFASSRLGALGPPRQRGDLLIALVGRRAPARLAQLLQRAVLALLAPVGQVRRVQPLATNQLTNLARPRARVRLARIFALYSAVNERRLACSTSSGSGTPSGAARPPAPEPQPGYAKLVFAAGGSSLNRCPGSIRARLLHVRRSPFSPSRSLIPPW